MAIKKYFLYIGLGLVIGYLLITDYAKGIPSGLTTDYNTPLIQDMFVFQI